MSWESGLYRGDYRRRRELLFASKGAESVCWRCGEPERPDDRFEAGHVIDGNRFSPLAFEHKSCNRSAGARSAFQVLASPASQDWTKESDG